MAPCVLIVDEAFVRKVAPSELAARAKFGLNIQLLFVGPLNRRELREDLLEMGFMGFGERVCKARYDQEGCAGAGWRRALGSAGGSLASSCSDH